MSDLSFLSVSELRALLQSRQVSATELASHFLQRLEQLGPRFNAVVTVLRQSALAEAAVRDRELAAGNSKGPLHGIPYGVKDLLATDGAPTTWGAEPYRHQMLSGDATVVSRLRQAGAVLCAKLAMVELAGGMGTTRHSRASPGRVSVPGTPRAGPAGRPVVQARLSVRQWSPLQSARRRGARFNTRRHFVE